MTSKTEMKVLSHQVNDVAWDGAGERLIAVGKGNQSYGQAFRIDGGNSGEVPSNK
jgi:hypothetical protein